MNKYAQSFVDAVRSTGGNNTTRNLIVNTYACACGRGDWNGHLKDPLINFNLPKDVKDGHLILGVHTYFDTGNPIQTVKDEVDDCMKVINEYLIPKGAPIIISEWGADAVEELYYKYPKTTVDFAQYFMQKVREKRLCKLLSFTILFIRAVSIIASIWKPRLYRGNDKRLLW